MDREITLDFSSILEEYPLIDKTEKNFEISLPTMVTGVDAFGNHFQEKTELSSISAKQATFLLKSRVTINSKLKLILNIPKTLILENPLKLIISGRVLYAKLEPNQDNKQLISILLDKKYFIYPIS